MSKMAFPALFYENLKFSNFFVILKNKGGIMRVKLRKEVNFEKVEEVLRGGYKDKIVKRTKSIFGQDKLIIKESPYVWAKLILNKRNVLKVQGYQNFIAKFTSLVGEKDSKEWEEEIAGYLDIYFKVT
jgi:hypothetical protein